MSAYTESRRKQLNRALKAMPTDALVAIKSGLESEPYVCVGTWVNNGVCSTTNKSVGCLLAAAYMHTPHFEEELRHENYRTVMGHFDIDPESTLREAFNLEWGYNEDPIEDLVNAFDSWANSSDALHEYIEYGTGNPYNGGRYQQNVLTKRAQKSLIRTIDRLIEERS